jgi:hypothetical protein
MTQDEIKKILEKQLQLLSEQSQEKDNTALTNIELSNAMCKIVETLDAISHQHLDHWKSEN